MTEIEYFIENLDQVHGLKSVQNFIQIYGLKRKARFRERLILRQELTYRLRKYSKLTAHEVGELFDQKHCNVLHSVKVIQGYKYVKDPIYLSIISKFEQELNQLNYA